MLDTTQNSISDLSLYDFEVKPRRLALTWENKHPQHTHVLPPPQTVVPECFGHGVVRYDEDGFERILGIVGPRTKIHPYKDNCEIVNEALSNNQDIDLTDIKITNELFEDGAFMRRTIEFPRMPIEPQIGDVVNFRIIHFDSYNSKWATQVIGQPIRLWCKNGCGDADYTIKYYNRHGNTGMTLEQFNKTLEAAVIDFQNQEGRFKQMIETQVHYVHAHHALMEFAKTAKNGHSRNSVVQRERVGFNFSEPEHARLLTNWQIEYERGGHTLFTLYNALTRWATHAETTGKPYTVQRQRDSRVANFMKSDTWKQLETGEYQQRWGG